MHHGRFSHDSQLKYDTGIPERLVAIAPDFLRCGYQQ